MEILTILLITLIALSAFFSALETAYSSVNLIRLKNLASLGNKKAKRAVMLCENYDKTVSAILIGNNIVNISSASIGTIVFTNLCGEDIGVTVSTIAMTVIVLVFGEVLPKSLAKDNAEGFCLAMASTLYTISMVLTPVIFLFVLLKKLFSKKNKEAIPSVTEEELLYIIDEIKDEGVLDEQESNLARQAIEFGDILVDEILTHRVDVVSIDIHDTNDQILDIVNNSRFSRLPVFDKNIDNVIGVLHKNDFYKHYLKDKNFLLKDILKKTVFLPAQKKIADILLLLQKEKIHMGVVTDEYGGTLGIVTLEDILEELVGDIWDETDEDQQYVRKIADDTYLVKGEYNIYDLFEKLEIDDQKLETQNNTVGGFIFEKLERIPIVGEQVSFEKFNFKVIKMDSNRVTLVEFKIQNDIPTIE